ncbi:MAG: type IV pilus twitching motility protein PilT [Actinomycetales bacterium]
MSLLPLLRVLVDAGGSDLHVKVGSPPRVRIDGRLRRLQAEDVTPADTEAMLGEILPPALAEQFSRTHEADFAHSVPGVGRFRINAFRQRGTPGLVVRRVAVGATPLHELGLPEVVGRLALEPRGLVLVTGPTGSGKTTTLAAMIDHINSHRESHIVTIEDPIEVIHSDKMSMVNQREIPSDSRSFTVALRAALRQDPDVILVGEMRDAETVEAAMRASETGHLVLSTLHTNSAAETVTRVVDFFPPHEQRQVRLTLASTLRGVVCQRLVAQADGAGRVVCMEVAVATGRIAEAVADPDLTAGITEIVRDGAYYGMQTFDQHLVRLVHEGVVSVDEARASASNPHDLQVELRRLGLVA